MARLLGQVAEPAAATGTVEVQRFLFPGRPIAEVQDHPGDRQEGDDGHNDDDDWIIHGIALVVLPNRPGCNEKRLGNFHVER